MAREIFEAMYARFTENDTPDLIDLTLDSDPGKGFNFNMIAIPVFFI